MLLLDIESKGKKWKKRFYFDRNSLNFSEVGDIVQKAWRKEQSGSRFFKLQHWRKEYQKRKKMEEEFLL